jgi:hypothetical protein
VRLNARFLLETASCFYRVGGRLDVIPTVEAAARMLPARSMVRR